MAIPPQARSAAVTAASRWTMAASAVATACRADPEMRCACNRAAHYGGPVITYEWRGAFTNAEVSALYAEAFGHQCRDGDWRAQLERHSLGWVCARTGAALAGFVNIAWDGACHAFMLDTLMARRMQRQGMGTSLVAVVAGRPARSAASGCTSTSRTICARSISAVADSGQQTRGSSLCRAETPTRCGRQTSGHQRKAFLSSIWPVPCSSSVPA